jgi:hypothetical protein
LKQLNFTINDDAHEKLEQIKTAKGVQNNAEAIEFLIVFAFNRMEDVKKEGVTK